MKQREERRSQIKISYDGYGESDTVPPTETWVSALAEAADLGSIFGCGGVGVEGGFKSSYLQNNCSSNAIPFSI